MPIGTNDKVEQFIRDFLVHDVKVEVASNPEFLAQGTAVRDTLKASRIVIGTETPVKRNLQGFRYTDCISKAPVSGDDKICIQ